MPAATAPAAAAPASTLYEVLGVAPDATLADIRQAYLRAAREHHPDRQPQQGQAQAQTQVRCWTGLDRERAWVGPDCCCAALHRLTHTNPPSPITNHPPKQRPPSPAVDDDDDGGSTAFLLIKEAWDALSDPAMRAAYDKGLAGRWGLCGVDGIERDGWTD